MFLFKKSLDIRPVVMLYREGLTVGNLTTFQNTMATFFPFSFAKVSNTTGYSFSLQTFTAPIGGQYLCAYQFSHQKGTGVGITQNIGVWNQELHLLKNGITQTVMIRPSTFEFSSANGVISTQTIIDLNAGDTIQALVIDCEGFTEDASNEVQRLSNKATFGIAKIGD